MLLLSCLCNKQLCPPVTGMSNSICDGDSGMGWMSNISEASGSSGDGTTFEIMWDNDPNLSTMSQGDYVVAFRRLGVPPPLVQILMPVSKTNGTQYVTVKE